MPKKVGLRSTPELRKDLLEIGRNLDCIVLPVQRIGRANPILEGCRLVRCDSQDRRKAELAQNIRKDIPSKNYPWRSWDGHVAVQATAYDTAHLERQ